MCIGLTVSCAYKTLWNSAGERQQVKGCGTETPMNFDNGQYQ